MTASNHRPRLRRVEPRRVQYQGQPFIHLHDPLGIAERTILLPEGMAPLLALADGTRDAAGLQASLLLRTGVHIPQEQIQELVDGLDEACLLDNDTYEAAVAAALTRYREAESRPPSHAGAVYPDNRSKLAAALSDYEGRAPDVEPLPESARVTGVVSPHIDYERGWQTYAQLWGRCSGALDDVELVVILGTDHKGGPGTLTLTRQSYASPLGTLPTDREVVDGLAGVIGESEAFEDEIHHLSEHSIELAAVWLQRGLGREVPTVPILCGSLHEVMMGGSEVEGYGRLDDAIGYLEGVIRERRTLVIAAGDLAHVGPAFGDPSPVAGPGRASLAAADARTIAAIDVGDAQAFLDISRAERDARKICGISPIYIALRLLHGSRGESLGYDQCPADSGGGSLVSIVGSILWEDGG